MKGMNKRKDFSGIIQNKLKKEDFTEKEWKKIIDCETKINQFIYENETFLMIIGKTSKPTEEMERLLQNIAEGYAFLFLEGLDVQSDKSFRYGFENGYDQGIWDEKYGMEYDNPAEKDSFDPEDWKKEIDEEYVLNLAEKVNPWEVREAGLAGENIKKYMPECIKILSCIDGETDQKTALKALIDVANDRWEEGHDLGKGESYQDGFEDGYDNGYKNGFYGAGYCNPASKPGFKAEEWRRNK